jgi:polyphenol oxidase
MFFSSKLSKFQNIKHCFFSRKNGVSKGIYDSLNCGLGSDDKNENVLKNLEIVSKTIGCDFQSLITLNQTHSNKVVFFDNKGVVKNKLLGDSIVSKVKNIGIGILTADCAPILFYDPKNKIIGCAHSGWKGSFNGVVKNTIKKFKDLNSNTDDLIAVVGPCIDMKNYIVQIDFVKKFINKNKKNDTFFQKIDDEKYIFDLRGFINKELVNLNVKNIENIEMDTFSNKDFFYSYRRSRLNKEIDYGRCISVILMT